jgi:hypothetical protein
LTSLTGLSTTVQVDRLTIARNPELATAAAEAFAAAVGVSDAHICGNAGDAGDAGFCPEFGCPGLDVPPPD